MLYNMEDKIKSGLEKLAVNIIEKNCNNNIKITVIDTVDISDYEKLLIAQVLLDNKLCINSAPNYYNLYMEIYNMKVPIYRQLIEN